MKRLLNITIRRGKETAALATFPALHKKPLAVNLIAGEMPIPAIFTPTVTSDACARSRSLRECYASAEATVKRTLKLMEELSRPGGTLLDEHPDVKHLLMAPTALEIVPTYAEPKRRRKPRKAATPAAVPVAA